MNQFVANRLEKERVSYSSTRAPPRNPFTLVSNQFPSPVLLRQSPLCIATTRPADRGPFSHNKVRKQGKLGRWKTKQKQGGEGKHSWRRNSFKKKKIILRRQNETMER